MLEDVLDKLAPLQALNYEINRQYATDLKADTTELMDRRTKCLEDVDLALHANVATFMVAAGNWEVTNIRTDRNGTLLTTLVCETRKSDDDFSRVAAYIRCRKNYEFKTTMVSGDSVSIIVGLQKGSKHIKYRDYKIEATVTSGLLEQFVSRGVVCTIQTFLTNTEVIADIVYKSKKSTFIGNGI